MSWSLFHYEGGRDSRTRLCIVIIGIHREYICLSNETESSRCALPVRLSSQCQFQKVQRAVKINFFVWVNCVYYGILKWVNDCLVTDETYENLSSLGWITWMKEIWPYLWKFLWQCCFRISDWAGLRTDVCFHFKKSQCNFYNPALPEWNNTCIWKDATTGPCNEMLEAAPADLCGSH